MGKQADSEQRPLENKSRRAVFSVCGQACGQTKTEKVGRLCLAEKHNKNRPFPKENGLFLVVEGEIEPAISVL